MNSHKRNEMARAGDRGWRRWIVVLAAVMLASAVVVSPIGVAGAQTSGTETTGGTGGSGPGEYNITIAGQPALLIVGENYDPNTPTHLAYYLHGDEGGYTFLTLPGSPVLDLINDEGWVFISPRAPVSSLDPTYFPWDGTGGDIAQNQLNNANQVAAAIDYVFDRYDIYRNQVFGAGASGGSWFHDMIFFPTRGADYPSYFALNCGAGGLMAGGFNYAEASAVAASDAAAHAELAYQIGTADFLFPGAQTSSATYAALGISVITEFYPGVVHCGFQINDETAEYWAGTASRLAGAAGPVCDGRPVTVDLSMGESPTAGDDVILGTAGADVIAASDGNDLICGMGGDDLVWGQAGNDRIIGGDGNDRLRGGPGNDVLLAGAGADDLNGGSGDDEVFGEDGNDVFVRGGTGDDLVVGGDGDDAIVAGNGGVDRVFGGNGNDKVTGGPRPDLLYGEDGDDFLRGLGGADQIFGGPGNDELFGGKQPDTLDGGPGTDTCSGGTTGGGALENDTATSCEGVLTSIP